MTSKDIIDEVRSIFGSKWKTREGRIVPDTDNIKLTNDAVIIAGTVLYADMSDSTNLVNNFKDWFAAEMYKAFLIGACKVIRDLDGEITAFDGDRVMAIFTGDTKNTDAVKTALRIKYLVSQINLTIKQSYPQTAFSLGYTVGIDTSNLFVAKTGIRNSNDLVWVGRSANYAAKLCGLGNSTYPTYITENVYSKIANEAKYGGNPRKDMWEKQIWASKGIVVYRSSWWWEF